MLANGCERTLKVSRLFSDKFFSEFFSVVFVLHSGSDFSSFKGSNYELSAKVKKESGNSQIPPFKHQKG